MNLFLIKQRIIDKNRKVKRMEDRVIKIFQKHINDPVIEFEHINNGVTNQTYRIKTNKYIYIYCELLVKEQILI